MCLGIYVFIIYLCEKRKNMDTVIIQVTSPETINLLYDLEKLRLLKILKRTKAQSGKLSDKYAGKLPLNVTEDLQGQIEKDREEWENNI